MQSTRISVVGASLCIGRSIAQAVSRWRPAAAAGFKPGSGQVGFVVDKVALGRVFSEYFGFPCQSSFHQILYHHNLPGQVQLANQWPPGRVDPTGLHPHYENKKLKKAFVWGFDKKIYFLS
jgi:hypothetical protein